VQEESEFAAHFRHERHIPEIQFKNRAQPIWRVWELGFFTTSFDDMKFTCVWLAFLLT
jgi:hypothetical protein